jgi:hypothetical protein
MPFKEDRKRTMTNQYDDYQETEDNSLSDPSMGLFLFAIFVIVVISVLASVMVLGCKGL